MALPLRDSSLQEKIYSAQDFQIMPEFDENYELVEGRLVKKDMPGYRHAFIARLLLKAYDRFDPDERIGRFVQEISVVLGPKDVPAPDLAFWQKENLPVMTDKAASRPDLVVEILSPRDIETKKRREEIQAKVRRYQAAGVKIIWVINPAKKSIEIYQPGQLEPVNVLGETEILDGGELIPGFTYSIAKLFE